jgi:hypothetical protein
MQMSMFSINVLHEIDSSTLGFDGADLKRIAHCDDGHDYAMKRVEDDPRLPLSEWVSYHLFKACGVLVPDFAILKRDQLPPAFGSRIVPNSNQIQKNPDAYAVTAYFSNHHSELSLIYPMDAFLPNPDRHGRNILKRQAALGESLLAIDFSRAWLMNGTPFGDESCLAGSNSETWWKYLHGRLNIKANYLALDKIVNQLNDDWLSSVVNLAPDEWKISINVNEVNEFWMKQRFNRVSFAKSWTK